MLAPLDLDEAVQLCRLKVAIENCLLGGPLYATAVPGSDVIMLEYLGQKGVLVVLEGATEHNDRAALVQIDEEGPGALQHESVDLIDNRKCIRFLSFGLS